MISHIKYIGFRKIVRIFSRIRLLSNKSFYVKLDTNNTEKGISRDLFPSYREPGMVEAG